MWVGIRNLAKGYKYAEQAGFAGQFQHWEDSLYYVDPDHPLYFDVNNSNTFARYLLKQSKIAFVEMLPEEHPGRLFPKDGPYPWPKAPPPVPD
jgi:hypothetical protein